jgi:hypothetical protein
MKIKFDNAGNFTAALLSASLPMSEFAASSPLAVTELKSNVDYQTAQSSPIPAPSGESTEPVLQFRKPPEVWTKPLEREWRALARIEAKGVILKDDLARLEQLSFTRRTLTHPQNAEEIVWQIKHRRLVDQLTEAVKQYVTFHGRPGAKG